MWLPLKNCQKFVAVLVYPWRPTTAFVRVIFWLLLTTNKSKDGFPNWPQQNGLEHGDLLKPIQVPMHCVCNVLPKKTEIIGFLAVQNWITHGITGDVAVVLARTGELLDSRGITAFVVERGTPGFRGGKKENKLGMRASETAEMIFEECRVPETNILGNIGDGFIQAMKILDGGRISIAALSLGIAKGAYEAALKYSKEREQFGKSISNFQAIAFKLADMATKIEAAELLTQEAADRKNKGLGMTKEGAMAKYYASEVSVYCANEAVQIFGGYGYTKDFPVEKFYRDCKLCTIGEGTSEIQKMVISRNILKD